MKRISLNNPKPGTSARSTSRTIHLIDVENLVGSSEPSHDEVADVCRLYRRAAGVGPLDHFVIASGASAAASVWFGWGDRPVRRLLRRGVDGADKALLEVIELEGVGSRFDRVVIGSGDGIFAEACAHLQAGGTVVAVVSRRNSTSARLRLAVPDVRYLEFAPRAPATVVRATVVA